VSLCVSIVAQETIAHALAFVGGVMMAVAWLELLPESLLLNRHAMTFCGFVTGVLVMGTSLYFLD
jgi:zinc transporter ZupT